jgi:hypothetical protein
MADIEAKQNPASDDQLPQVKSPRALLNPLI